MVMQLGTFQPHVTENVFTEQLSPLPPLMSGARKEGIELVKHHGRSTVRKDSEGIWAVVWSSVTGISCIETVLFVRDFYLFMFRERGREREREGEKHQCVVATCVPPTEDLVCNLGMCPD